MLGAKFWQRPEEPVAELRRKKPIKEKESYRWLESYDLACDVQRQCPQTLIVSIADREGDIGEWFLNAQNRPLEEKTEFIVRAKCNRRTGKGVEECSYLWDKLSEAPVLGKLKINTPRTGNKPSRQATLALHAKEVEFVGKQGKAKASVTVTAVYAREIKPPKGTTPIS